MEVHLRVPKAIPRLLLACIAVLVAALCAQTASADPAYLDFSCSGLAGCNGTILQNSNNFSTTGITLTEGSGFYAPGSQFLLAFDTSTNAISLTGLGALSGEVFTGMITSFPPPTVGNTTTDVNFTADWPTIPADVQAFFQSPQGTDSGFAIFLSGSGGVTSADITITAPEPAAPILLGAGLIGLAFLKRKGVSFATQRAI